MFAVVGIHEFSFGQNRVLCRGSRGGWLLEILSVLRHRKEFQFQECGHQFREGGATVSILAAIMKSFSERPPIAWV